LIDSVVFQPGDLEENDVTLKAIESRVSRLLEATSWGTFLLKSCDPPKEYEANEKAFYLYGTSLKILSS